jgi:predicted ATPase/class 3 adenylate cyclase
VSPVSSGGGTLDVTRSTLPTGTVTFVFTDIEGSTQLVSQLGDRFPSVLDEHHRVLREVFAEHRGVEVSTEGDAFFVVFTSAQDAATAAVYAQRALADHDWGEGIAVRVRLGMHTGEGSLVGDNYGGIDVHRAARISSVGHGGQIVLSETTRTLVEPGLPNDVRIKDLGEHGLKDLDRREHLYQLCIDGLPSDFPALRSLQARPNNLPVTLTSFIPRDEEVVEVIRLLGSNRLVTLTGPGGTGKTRLGIEVATRSLVDFKDGVFVVLLASVTDPDLVASSIAEALGVREQGMTPISTLLKDFIGPKKLLLLLDNFEQLVSAGGFVTEILAAAPGVKAVVTSRAALRVSGEQEYPVPPMTAPNPERVSSPEGLSGYEAVELFVQRAGAVKPNFVLSNENARSVAEICWRLDGLPLAIELAAARIRLLTPDDIVKRLGRSLSLLAGGARDLPARQRTLRGAIDWSYDLLDESMQAFFRRLGVFMGGFSLEGADEICNPGEELGVNSLDTLEALVENSLVKHFETDDRETRFRMLETIREFAVEKLEAAGDDGGTRGRHADFYRSFVMEGSPGLTSSTETANLFEAEHGNLRAALGWSIANEEAGLALEMGSAMWRFWMLRSHLAEGERWMSDILSMPGAAERDALRAKGVMALGSVKYWQNDFVATRRHYEEGLEILRVLNDKPGIAEALYNLAFVYLIDRDAAGARSRFEESRRLAQDLGDEQGLANTAWGLAMTAIHERDWGAAQRFGEETEARFTKLNDWFGISLAHFVFFQIARYKGDYDEAERLTREYLDLTTAMDDMVSAFTVMDMYVVVAMGRGNHERAVKLGGAAQALREVYGGGSPPPLVDVDDPREKARGILSDTRIDELWAEGLAMSADEALTYARKDPND